MKMMSLAKELSSNTYPGRGIVIGRSGDGKYAVTAYFIMGRSENSRNKMCIRDSYDSGKIKRIARGDEKAEDRYLYCTDRRFS